MDKPIEIYCLQKILFNVSILYVYNANTGASFFLFVIVIIRLFKFGLHFYYNRYYALFDKTRTNSDNLCSNLLPYVGTKTVLVDSNTYIYVLYIYVCYVRATHVSVYLHFMLVSEKMTHFLEVHFVIYNMIYFHPLEGIDIFLFLTYKLVLNKLL